MLLIVAYQRRSQSKYEMKVHRDMFPEFSFFGLFYTVCNDCWPLWLILAHNHPHENLGASFCSASLIPEKCHGMIGNTAPHTQFPQQKSAISSNLCDDHITTAPAAFFMLNSLLLQNTVHSKWEKELVIEICSSTYPTKC